MTLQNTKGQNLGGDKVNLSDEVSIKKVLVPLDGSKYSFEAAKYAVYLAKVMGATVELVHAIVNPPYSNYPAGSMLLPRFIDEAKAEAARWFKEVKAFATENGVSVTGETILDTLSVADSVASYAQQHNSDLIVVGTRGRGAVKRFLMGSVASGLVTHAHCPVLVIR